MNSIFRLITEDKRKSNVIFTGHFGSGIFIAEEKEDTFNLSSVSNLEYSAKSFLIFFGI
jgi:hypothetical protein